MKYFSPSILDGSVTSAKIAGGAVTRTKLMFSTASQGGTIGIQGKVTVALNLESLFPDIEADNPVSASLDVQVLSNHKAVPAADALNPQFDLRNEDTGATRDYDVAWVFHDV